MERMDSLPIPHGNTQPQVNGELIVELSLYLDGKESPQLLDLPCGDASFLEYLSLRFPESRCYGVEIERMPVHEERKNIHLVYTDLSKPFELHEKFDAITSVSGVMEFENTSLFLENCYEHLKPNGLLLLTNDNISTLRDRYSFFLFGKFRRFALNLWPGFATYKAISVQELYKMVKERGFEIERVVYTAARIEDWFLLPIALLIYPFQAMYFLREKSPMPRKIRFALFPLRALLCRHYFFVAKKR